MTWSCRRGAFRGTRVFRQAFRKTRYMKMAGRMACRYLRPGVYLLIRNCLLEGKIRILQLNNSMLSFQVL
jgi:hypothetical protein